MNSLFISSIDSEDLEQATFNSSTVARKNPALFHAIEKLISKQPENDYGSILKRLKQKRQNSRSTAKYSSSSQSSVESSIKETKAQQIRKQLDKNLDSSSVESKTSQRSLRNPFVSKTSLNSFTFPTQLRSTKSQTDF